MQTLIMFRSLTQNPIILSIEVNFFYFIGWVLWWVTVQFFQFLLLAICFFIEDTPWYEHNTRLIFFLFLIFFFLKRPRNKSKARPPMIQWILLLFNFLVEICLWNKKAQIAFVFFFSIICGYYYFIFLCLDYWK